MIEPSKIQAKAKQKPNKIQTKAKQLLLLINLPCGTIGYI